VLRLSPVISQPSPYPLIDDIADLDLRLRVPWHEKDDLAGSEFLTDDRQGDDVPAGRIFFAGVRAQDMFRFSGTDGNDGLYRLDGNGDETDGNDEDEDRYGDNKDSGENEDIRKDPGSNQPRRESRAREFASDKSRNHSRQRIAQRVNKVLPGHISRLSEIVPFSLGKMDVICSNYKAVFYSCECLAKSSVTRPKFSKYYNDGQLLFPVQRTIPVFLQKLYEDRSP
jgi:hypothetical protein